MRSRKRYSDIGRVAGIDMNETLATEIVMAVLFIGAFVYFGIKGGDDEG